MSRLSTQLLETTSPLSPEKLNKPNILGFQCIENIAFGEEGLATYGKTFYFTDRSRVQIKLKTL